MITAVDTCVVLDVLHDDPDFATRSIAALRRARREGRLVICEMVVAALVPVVGDDLGEMLRDFGLDFLPCDLASAERAGRKFADYLARGGKRGRIVADFLIGEHASLHADRLLTRDRAFARQQFGELEIWYP